MLAVDGTVREWIGHSGRHGERSRTTGPRPRAGDARRARPRRIARRDVDRAPPGARAAPPGNDGIGPPLRRGRHAPAPWRGSSLPAAYCRAIHGTPIGPESARAARPPSGEDRDRRRHRVRSALGRVQELALPHGLRACCPRRSDPGTERSSARSRSTTGTPRAVPGGACVDRDRCTARVGGDRAEARGGCDSRMEEPLRSGDPRERSPAVRLGSLDESGDLRRRFRARPRVFDRRTRVGPRALDRFRPPGRPAFGDGQHDRARPREQSPSTPRTASGGRTVPTSTSRTTATSSRTPGRSSAWSASSWTSRTGSDPRNGRGRRRR